MTLEELKALMDEALKASQAASSDKKLQTAYETAKAAYEAKLAEAEGDPDPAAEVDPDETKLDEKTKAYLAKLRKEAAGHRTKAKDLASKLKISEDQKRAVLKAVGIEDESESPEEKLKTLSTESQQLAFRTAILESAVENGIGKDDLGFYEFLVSKAVQALEEGDELSEEQMAEIVAQVGKRGGGKGSANSSVGTGGKGKGAPNPEPKAGDVTLEKFIRMSITEKSKLYETNEDLYLSLMSQAKAQKKLV